MWDGLALIESPIQILIVLTIALLVFGPNKLPEIGRQIGGALRELRKAAGEVSRSFTTDYDPEPSTYDSTSSYDRTASYYTPPPAIDAPIDLSDYTMVGVSVPEAPSEEPERPAAPTDGIAADMMPDYTLVGAWGGTAESRKAESDDAPSKE